ncbi:glycerate kinase [Pseudotamlana carrageenivorans]|uniref:Glycerate kinase n=1 Tax=Pseudotamlana carrageenivorans TaxID=2069432 RepID=A0A2I7SIB3_9FLAO|nr:glycerate kinase [Tamlana carrageenivorans]AUS05626.1 glycerate kinase [Tamlana carrageenivorans]
MKIVLAPDKFKNSVSGFAFCKAVEAGLKEIRPDLKVVSLPLADGGDGTIDIINFYLKGEFVSVQVHNPFFERISASYLFAEKSKTAFIEMAEASGLKLLKLEELDCKNATTLGAGELIVDALNQGAEQIILGIGGSATNDCGIGMASALGYRFLDENDKEVKPIGANLSKIKRIDASYIHAKLKSVKFQIACDVENLLYGKNGAVQVYAKQKGANKKDRVLLEQGLQDFSKVLENHFNMDVQSVKGGGAAGGMGIASKVFLNGILEPGITLVKDLVDFDHQIQGAIWLITGEGKLDVQTLSGKTIRGVLDSAKAKKIKVAALCGAIDLNENKLRDFGIDYADSVLNYSENLNDAMENGKAYLVEMARIFAKKHL